jgi:hypothetical protein
MGKVYAILTRLLVLRGVPDPQCDLKVYRGDLARAIFAKVRDDVGLALLAMKVRYPSVIPAKAVGPVRKPARPGSRAPARGTGTEPSGRRSPRRASR